MYINCLCYIINYISARVIKQVYLTVSNWLLSSLSVQELAELLDIIPYLDILLPWYLYDPLYFQTILLTLKWIFFH